MRSRLLAGVTAVTLAAFTPPVPAASTAAAVFDDFDGPAGASPDAAIWGYDLGNPSPDNHELQVYTRSAANVSLDGAGHLAVRALRSGATYTSARVVTRDKLTMFYGRVSARIKVPTGAGVWPAFWMLGSHIDSVGWPACGEVDIMELPNTASVFNVTLHGPRSGTDYLGGEGVGTTGPIADLSNDFHDYWMSWKKNWIKVGVDGTTLGEFSPASLPPGGEWVFNHPMYAILNVAVGGDWPGAPTAETRFPATMLVDWFRYTPEA